MSSTMKRQMLAVAVPVPVVAIAAISQPKEAQLLAGLFAFVPILAALAVLFGGDATRSGVLGGEFELKRALRGLAGMVPLVLALVLLNSASFLFPKPVFDLFVTLSGSKGSAKVATRDFLGNLSRAARYGASSRISTASTNGVRNSTLCAMLAQSLSRSS